jgi:hypothetical protein
MKIGTTWEIKDYTIYQNDGNGNLILLKGPNYLQFKITDVKKSNVKCFYIVALKVSWNLNLDIIEEYITGIYDIKNKKISAIEPKIQQSSLGFDNLSILKNGKLRVKYLAEAKKGYVVDLPKIKN